jgi:hypothetical protein
LKAAQTAVPTARRCWPVSFDSDVMECHLECLSPMWRGRDITQNNELLDIYRKIPRFNLNSLYLHCGSGQGHKSNHTHRRSHTIGRLCKKSIRVKPKRMQVRKKRHIIMISQDKDGLGWKEISLHAEGQRGSTRPNEIAED